LSTNKATPSNDQPPQPPSILEPSILEFFSKNFKKSRVAPYPSSVAPYPSSVINQSNKGYTLSNSGKKMPRFDENKYLGGRKTNKKYKRKYPSKRKSSNFRKM